MYTRPQHLSKKTMLFLRLALALCLARAASSAAAYATTPEAFGAAGDGKTDDSEAIARAVASCSSHGGGGCTVVFAKEYLSGPILINASSVTIHVSGKLMMLPKKAFTARNPAHRPFLSNGPGDPALCVETIESLSKVLSLEGDDVKPIFGICLGNQLMGLAAGAETFKLPFGNRGQNVPVVNDLNGDAYITPQNHGYAIDTKTLPGGWKPLFTNANDGSNEGILHETKPYFSAQVRRRGGGGAKERTGSMMTYKTQDPITIMRVAGSATSAMRKPQIFKRVRNDEA